MAKPESTSRDRRDFLKAAAGGAAALAAGSMLTGIPGWSAPQSAGSSAAPEKLRIDMHGHIYPNQYLDMLDKIRGRAEAAVEREHTSLASPMDLERQRNWTAASR